MNKLYITFILFFVSFNLSVIAQTFDIGIQAGIGTYKMQDLKELTIDVSDELPFQAKLISNYPSYFYYKPILLFSYEKLTVGFHTTYCSTGSKISLKDYSGEYIFNTKIHCIIPGIHIGYELATFPNKFNMAMYIEGGIVFSKLNFDESLTLYDQELLNSSYFFKSQNYNVELGLKFAYNFYKSFTFDFNTGYFFQFGEGVLNTDNDETLNIGPDWSGLRLALTLIYSLPQKN